MTRSNTLKVNLALLYSAELLAKVLGVVVFGYLARVLTPGRYGDLEFAIGLLVLLNLFVEAGLAQYGAREASRQPDRVPELVSQIVVIRGALLVPSLLLMLGLYLGLDRDHGQGNGECGGPAPAPARPG